MSTASSGSSSSSSKRSPSQSKEVVSTSATTSSSSVSTTSGGAGASSSTKTPQSQTIRDSMYVLRNGAGAANISGNQSGRSPISPSRITRLQEKEEMQNLNDRLVIYIDTVRRLESENTRLQSIVMNYSENSTRDVSEIKKLYENELEDAKRLIDELAKEKARYEIELNKFKADTEEALAKLAKKDRELKTLEGKFKTSESEKIEYKSRYEALLAEQAHNAEELKQLRPQVLDYEKQLGKLKKQLEDETLLRVDLENKNQTIKEDLVFKSQLYGKEIDQLRSSKRIEIEQVDVRLRDEYDSRLVSELQRIRDETDYKINEMKDEVERRYQNKFTEFDANAKRAQQISASLREELSTYRSKSEELSGEIKTLLAKIASNEAKIKELEDKLRKAQLKYDKDMSEKDTEVQTMRKEINDLLTEYQELYDIKIALDMEISAYRKLLESEEQRLNISTSGVGVALSAHHSALNASYLGADGQTSSSATRANRKRRHVNTLEQDEQVGSSSATTTAINNHSITQSQQSMCGVEIGENDYEGRGVKLTNTNTDKEVALGGWLLKRTADGQVTEYKFNKAAVIKPGQTISVWSSNAGVTHEPPNDLVMNSQRWFVSDSMITVLQDKESNEQARRESQRILTHSLEKKLRSTPTRQAAAAAAAGEQKPQASAVQKLFGLWKS